MPRSISLILIPIFRGAPPRKRLMAVTIDGVTRKATDRDNVKAWQWLMDNGYKSTGMDMRRPYFRFHYAHT